MIVTRLVPAALVAALAVACNDAHPDPPQLDGGLDSGVDTPLERRETAPQLDSADLARVMPPDAGPAEGAASRPDATIDGATAAGEVRAIGADTANGEVALDVPMAPDISLTDTTASDGRPLDGDGAGDTGRGETPSLDGPPVDLAPGDAPTEAQAAGELDGAWHSAAALGPGPHTLSVTATSMVERTDSGSLEIQFRIDQREDDLDRFRATVIAIDAGTPPYPVGTVFYCSYRLSGDGHALALYFATGAYVPPSGGSEGIDFLSYVRR